MWLLLFHLHTSPRISVIISTPINAKCVSWAQISCFHAMLLHPTRIIKGHLKVNVYETKLNSPLASKLPVLCNSMNDMLIYLFVQSRKGVTFDSFFSLTSHPTINRKSCQFSLFDISQICASSSAIKFKPLSSLALPANLFPFLYPDAL